MCKDIRELPTFRLPTLDGRSVEIRQAVDRFQHPIIIVDILAATEDLQATFKLGYFDIDRLSVALRLFANNMLDSMDDL